MIGVGGGTTYRTSLESIPNFRIDRTQEEQMLTQEEIDRIEAEPSRGRIPSAVPFIVGGVLFILAVMACAWVLLV